MIITLPAQDLKTNDFRIVNGILYLKQGQSFQNAMYKLTYFMKGKNYCYYCKKKFPRDKITMDHMYPRSTGGPTIPENLLPSCKSCNGKKSDMTYSQFRVYLKLHNDKERKAYLASVNALKEGLKITGMYECPNHWITPIQLSNVHTATDFATISESKFQKARIYYNTYHSFQTPIIVDRNYHLLDGFHTLFVARYKQVQFIPGIVLENVEIRNSNY
mgnify:CR=1 FL=1